MFDRILLWSHRSWAFVFWEILITASISVLVIGLFVISNSFWLSLGRLSFSMNLSISSRLSILLHIVVHNSLIIFYISPLPVATSPFSFLILLIWFFSLFFLMSLAKGLSILFIFSRNQLLVLLILTIVSFTSFSCIAAQIFMIYFLLLILFFFNCCCCCSSFSSCFRYKVRLSIRCFSCLLKQDGIAINFPLRTAFAASHKFWIVFSLSFVSRNFFISLLISSVTCWLFRNVFFNLCVFVFLTVFFLVIDI